jgi:hypothetical protein
MDWLDWILTLHQCAVVLVWWLSPWVLMELLVFRLRGGNRP